MSELSKCDLYGGEAKEADMGFVTCQACGMSTVENDWHGLNQLIADGKRVAAARESRRAKGLPDRLVWKDRCTELPDGKTARDPEREAAVTAYNLLGGLPAEAKEKELDTWQAKAAEWHRLYDAHVASSGDVERKLEAEIVRLFCRESELEKELNDMAEQAKAWGMVIGKHHAPTMPLRFQATSGPLEALGCEILASKWEVLR